MRSMLWECEVTGPLQQWWPSFQSPWLGFWSTSRCISAKGYQNAEAAFRNAEVVDGLPSQPRAPSPELHADIFSHSTFRGFASNWLKTQPKGYRDYDRWCRNLKSMNSGRAALTSEIHENSKYTSLRYVDSEMVRPYENADYSRVPTVRVHDSRIPWLRSTRLFPKANGLQVMVHTHEHPPPHMHVELLNSNEVVRIEWSSSLAPLRGEPKLSARDERNLRSYLQVYQDELLAKLKQVYPREKTCSGLSRGSNSFCGSGVRLSLPAMR